MGSSDTTARVLIVTSSAAKMRVFMRQLTDWRQEEHESGWIYERTLLQTLVCTWEIIAIEAASGDEIKHALQVFEPRLAISIDTAIGIDGATVGDVVVASRVQSLRGFKRAVSFALLQKIRADARGRLERTQDAGSTLFQTGAILQIPPATKSLSSDDLGGFFSFDEHEATMLPAWFRSALVIRGIEHGNDAVQPDPERAMRNAVIFTLDLLSRIGPERADSGPAPSQGPGAGEAAPVSLPENAVLSLHVEHFRALRKVNWTIPRGVCVVVGPNGSGKTTLLGVPRFLWRAAEADVRKAIDEHGGPGELRNARAGAEALVSVGIALDALRWELKLSPKVSGANPLYSEHAAAGESSILDENPSGPRPLLRSIADHPDSVALQPLIQLLNSYRLYRAYDLNGLRRNGSQSSSDPFLYPDGGNLFSVLRNWRDRQETRERYEFVLEGLRAAFPGTFSDLDFEMAGQTVSGRILGPGGERLSTFSAADGWLTAILHLCAVASAERGGLLAIDEPENGLHPFAIREILGAMRRWCEPRAITAILATHSPVVLDQFKEDPARVLVMEPGAETVPVPLDQIHDSDWLAQFSLGYLYSHERFGQQGGAGEE